MNCYCFDQDVTIQGLKRESRVEFVIGPELPLKPIDISLSPYGVLKGAVILLSTGSFSYELRVYNYGDYYDHIIGFKGPASYEVIKVTDVNKIGKDNSAEFSWESSSDKSLVVELVPINPVKPVYAKGWMESYFRD